MKKMIPMSDRPIDGRPPSMSISQAMYESGIEMLREEAKNEKKILVTWEGIEDYRSGEVKRLDGSYDDALDMVVNDKTPRNRQIFKMRTIPVSPVEIVILYQNDYEITIKCLESLYTNTQEFSLILIGNGCSGYTWNRINEFIEYKENITLVRNDEDLGCIGGRNQGYDISCELDSQSEYICFLDNDQFVGKNWLDLHLGVMNHGYDIVGAEAWVIHDKTYLPIRHNDSLSQSYSYVGCGGMMIKRGVIEDIGLFEESLGKSYFEDPFYCFTAYYAGYKIGWNFKHRILHEQKQNSLTSDEKRKRFLSSYEKFKDRWQGHAVPMMLQRDLPEFH